MRRAKTGIPLLLLFVILLFGPAVAAETVKSGTATVEQSAREIANELGSLSGALYARWIDAYRAWREAGAAGAFESPWIDPISGGVRFGLLASLKDSGQLDAGFPLSEYSLSATATGELLVSRSCDPLLAEHIASILPFTVVGDDGASVTLFVQKPSDYIVAEMASPFVKQFIVRRDAKRRDATGAIESGTTFEDSAPVTLGTNAMLGWDDGTGRIYGVDDLAVSGKGTLGSGQSPTVTTNVATIENATVESGVVTETLAFSGGGEDARLSTSSSAGTWFRVSDGSGVTHLTVARNGELYLSNGSTNQVYHTGNIGSLGLDATWFDRGVLSRARLSGTYDVNTTGKSDTANLADQTVRLEIARRISVTGDMTGDATFDGSGNVVVNTTSGMNLAHRGRMPNQLQWTFQGLRVGSGNGTNVPWAGEGGVEIAAEGDGRTGARVYTALPSSYAAGGELRFQAASGWGTYYDASVTVRKDGLVAKSLMFDDSLELRHVGTTEQALRIAVSSGGTVFALDATKSLTPGPSGNAGVLVARTDEGDIAVRDVVSFGGKRLVASGDKFYMDGKELYTKANPPVNALGIQDLSDVDYGGQTPSSGNVLVYNAVRGQWEPKLAVLVPIAHSFSTSVVVPFSTVANNSMFPVEVEIENKLDSNFTVTSVLLYDGMTKVSEYGARPGATAGTGTTLVVPPGEIRALNVWFPMSTTKYNPPAGTRTWKAYVKYAETDIETEIPIEVTVWNPNFAVLTPHAATASGAGVWPSNQAINVASGTTRFINVWAVNRGYNSAAWGGVYPEVRSVSVAGAKGATGAGCSGSGCTGSGACARSCGRSGYGNAGANGTVYTLPVKSRSWRDGDSYALFIATPGVFSGGTSGTACNRGGSGGNGSSLTVQGVRTATTGPAGPVATLSAAGGAGGAGSSVSASSPSYSCNFTCHCTYSVKQPDTSRCGCSYIYRVYSGTAYKDYTGSLSPEANVATNRVECFNRCSVRIKTARIRGVICYEDHYSQSTGSTSSSSKTSGPPVVTRDSYECISWCNSNKPPTPRNAAFTGSVTVTNFNLTYSTCSCSCGACAGGAGGPGGGMNEIPSSTVLPPGTNITSGSNTGGVSIVLN